MIYASSINGVIGDSNKLPWHLPPDLKNFSKITKTGNVIMGRKTWESIGSKPLPNRINYVVTSSTSFLAPGAIVVNDLNSFIETYDEPKPLFVIGGSQLYTQLEYKCTKIFETRVLLEVEGDTKFIPDDTKWIVGNESDIMEFGGVYFQYVEHEPISHIDYTDADELLDNNSIINAIRSVV